MEARLDDIMKNLGWTAVPGTGGTYTHAKTGAAMVVYVDDMMMLSSPKDTNRFWRGLEKSVRHKEQEAPLQRYLAALYKFDVFDEKEQNARRRMLTSMDDYAAKAVQRFKSEYGKKLTTVTSLFYRLKIMVNSAKSLPGSPPVPPAMLPHCSF